MKIRAGFVSNSSSCSFTLPINMISPKMVYCILNNLENTATCLGHEFYSSGGWSIKLENDAIEGFTTMDNFGMLEFLEKIGVDISKIEYDDDNLGSNTI